MPNFCFTQQQRQEKAFWNVLITLYAKHAQSQSEAIELEVGVLNAT